MNEQPRQRCTYLASHLNLKDLTVIVDKNNFQQTGKNQDILDLKNLTSKWKSFGWETIDVNGHNLKEIYDALILKSNRPKAIIANTIKGKGVSFTENNNDWHHNILTQKNFEIGINEINNEKR